MEKMIIADKIASQLAKKELNKFWTHVKGMNNKQAPRAINVDNCSGSSAIVDMWKNHFVALLNNNTALNESTRSAVLTELKDNSKHVDAMVIETQEVQSALNYLKVGKAVGPDKLSSEHYKYASKRLTTLLKLLITAIFSHSYLPSDMMCTSVIPLLKDKIGDITDTNNYRPIALTTVISKMIGHIILQRYAHCLSTSDNQFSFKHNHFTDMAVFSLKEKNKYLPT